MNKRLFILPICTTVGGVLLAVLDYFYINICIYIAAKFNLTQVESINTFYSVLIWVLSITMIVIIGIKIKKMLSREEIIKSSLLLCGYSIIVLILQWGLQTNGIYDLILHTIMLSPVSIFSFPGEILAKIAGYNRLVNILSFILSPFLFMLFAPKKS